MLERVRLVFLLQAYCLGIALSAVPCAPPNQECDCEYVADGYVYCRGILTMPKRLPSNVTFLDLDSNKLGSALTKNKIEKLGSLSLSQLYLSGTGLKVIESKAFQLQSRIRTLDLSRNHFTRLEGKVFFGLSKLESLFLADSFLYEISSLVFKDLPNLRHLDLGNNKLQLVTDEFASLTNLKTLILTNNQIARISDDSFRSLSRLSRLEVAGNSLTVPRASLFNHIVSNNGTIKLQTKSMKNNWTCCGLEILEYHDFMVSLKDSGLSKQFDIECSSPFTLAGRMLSDITRAELSEAVCGLKAVVYSSLFIKFTATMPRTKSEAPTATTSRNVLDARDRVETFLFKSRTGNNINSLSRLSDGQIALVLIAIIVIVIAVTSFVVRHCVIEKRKKAFGEFVDNLPDAMEVDDDDALTTKTYRHDAPVYGSTGNVIDRHRRRTDFATYSISTAKDLPSDSAKPNERRKPPPYDPPSSPEGFAEAYEKPHSTNNNASTEASDDFYGHQRMLRRIASSPTEYDSDDGNVLWNIRNVK